jgi:hypothetical protein
VVQAAFRRLGHIEILKTQSSISWLILPSSTASKNQRIMFELVGYMRQLSGLNTDDARFGIVSILEEALSELKVASAGSDPKPTLPGAHIRRDNHERFFEIRLWDGPTYDLCRDPNTITRHLWSETAGAILVSIRSCINCAKKNPRRFPAGGSFRSLSDEQAQKLR